MSEEAKRKMSKLSELVSFSRQSLRLGFGLRPQSFRERALQSLEAWKQQIQTSNTLNQVEQRPIIQHQPIFIRPLQLLQQRLQPQNQPQSEEDIKLQVYLEQRRKEEVLRRMEEEDRQKKEEEERRKRREQLEKAKLEMGVLT